MGSFLSAYGENDVSAVTRVLRPTLRPRMHASATCSHLSSASADLSRVELTGDTAGPMRLEMLASAMGASLLAVGGYLIVRPQMRLSLMLNQPFVIARSITGYGFGLASLLLNK